MNLENSMTTWERELNNKGGYYEMGVHIHMLWDFMLFDNIASFRRSRMGRMESRRTLGEVQGDVRFAGEYGTKAWIATEDLEYLICKNHM